VALERLAYAAINRDSLTLSYSCHDALEHNSLFSNRFNIVLDSYFSCHLIDSQLMRNWVENAAKYLTPRGLLISFGFSSADEYYQNYLHRSGEGLIVSDDKRTRIAKRIDTGMSILSFYDQFEPIFIQEHRFSDLTKDGIFRRSILVTVLRRRW